MATLKKQVQEYVQMTVYGYLNGCVDDNYEALTENEWVDYVLMVLEKEKHIIVNGEEMRHLYFYGKDKIADEVRAFVRKDEWAQEWTKNEA